MKEILLEDLLHMLEKETTSPIKIKFISIMDFLIQWTYIKLIRMK